MLAFDCIAVALRAFEKALAEISLSLWIDFSAYNIISSNKLGRPERWMDDLLAAENSTGTKNLSTS